MASRAGADRAPEWRIMLRRSLLRLAALAGSVTLALGAALVGLALISFHHLNDSGDGVREGAGNLLGAPGGAIAFEAYFWLGLGAWLLLPLMVIFARRLWAGDDMRGWRGQIGECLGGILMLGLALHMLSPADPVDLPAKRGGVVMLFLYNTLARAIPPLGQAAPWLYWTAAAALLGAGAALWVRSLRLERPLLHIVPRATMLRLSGLSPFVRTAREEDPSAPVPDAVTGTEPEPRKPIDATPKPPINIQLGGPAPATKPFAPVASQDDLFGNGALPSPELLTSAPATPETKVDRQALEKNARLLESVLDDFNVKGHITEVRPGPVVTMYELEPAPGIKASRVIALADDIARNMSALSARVATVPGRTVMGIELPNTAREPVVLRQLIESQAFAGQGHQLPIILGKNISGEPIIADLAPMPHLLIAGTTGSGKSVGLNCMILSLLYRLTPDELRLIMIDPKMLELSTYDDIPHLLSPVVTEPAKAIRALKWAVEQMEDRYRMMASIGVRNLANYNEKVRAAKAKGKPLGRRVQTGYSPETGQPIYEEEQLDYQPLPQIVIVVDELADLMMTAGKEVEFLIQRLAQKARAAGLHLILATQRPSVDVITGVIKANLPTRISFFVTSKIDSRTILGEQGAEQLLGKGDMLYMAGGKALTRVHGPFVSDDEVRAVADHWRSKGKPDYISAVTEEPEDGGFALEGVDLGDDGPDAQLYRKACQLVFENQKASTSWLQRQLRVGYNSAARLIERMEQEGLVGPPNHVGRREVLRDESGQPI